MVIVACIPLHSVCRTVGMMDVGGLVGGDDRRTTGLGLKGSYAARDRLDLLGEKRSTSS